MEKHSVWYTLPRLIIHVEGYQQNEPENVEYVPLLVLGALGTPLIVCYHADNTV